MIESNVEFNFDSRGVYTFITIVLFAQIFSLWNDWTWYGYNRLMSNTESIAKKWNGINDVFCPTMNAFYFLNRPQLLRFINGCIGLCIVFECIFKKFPLFHRTHWEAYSCFIYWAIQNSGVHNVRLNVVKHSNEKHWHSWMAGKVDTPTKGFTIEMHR